MALPWLLMNRKLCSVYCSNIISIGRKTTSITRDAFNVYGERSRRYGSGIAFGGGSCRSRLLSTTASPLFGADVDSCNSVNRHVKDQFTLSSFNILAPCYKRMPILNSDGRRIRESTSPELWMDRAKHLFNFLEYYILPNAGVVALQEYWLDEKYNSEFRKVYSKLGFELICLQRTGMKTDALAFLVKSTEFETKGRENATLCEAGDRVGLIIWLRHRATSRDIIVANTHLSFPHSPLDRIAQMEQMKRLTGVIDRFGRDNQLGNVPKVVLGDFNVESNSPVCAHLRMKGYNSSFDIIPPYYSSSSNVNLSEKLRHDDFSSNIYPSIGTNCSFTRFISHRTHRNEDLGVDHIFVSSDLHALSSNPLDQTITDKNSHDSNTKNDNTDNSSSSSNSDISNRASADDSMGQSNSSHSNDSSCDKNSNISSNNNSNSNPLMTVSTRVDPTTLPFHIWDDRFNIVSDHRPISATFQFT